MKTDKFYRMYYTKGCTVNDILEDYKKKHGNPPTEIIVNPKAVATFSPVLDNLGILLDAQTYVPENILYAGVFDEIVQVE